MLVPLETLSGWPQVQNPPILQTLLLLVGIPLLVFIIVVALVKVGAAAHAAEAGAGDIVQVSNPLWVGAHESAQVVPVSDSQDARTPDEARAEVIGADARVDGDDTGEHVGGAGARW